jgi:hypothetical protein
MSLAEMKRNITALTSEERLELAAYLAELDDQDEARFNEALAQRMSAMDSGRKVSMEAFEAEHYRRAAQGK